MTELQAIQILEEMREIKNLLKQLLDNTKPQKYHIKLKNDYCDQN